MNFENDALGFLISYAKKHRGAAFSAEAVTLSAIEKGVAPEDLFRLQKTATSRARQKFFADSGVTGL